MTARGVFPRTVTCLGGGGKTSMLELLSIRCAEDYDKVMMTSLTSAGHPVRLPLVVDHADCRSALDKAFRIHNPLFYIEASDRIGKFTGVDPDKLAVLRGMTDIMLIENDGARNLPLKWHKSHDPAVPAWSELSIIMAGAEVVNQRLDSGLVHRPEDFAQGWSITPESVLYPDFLADVLTSPKGYGSRIRHSHPLIYIVNKGDAYPEKAQALARAVAKKTSGTVAWGSVHLDQWQVVR